MIAPIINTIALAIFGLTMGAIFHLASLPYHKYPALLKIGSAAYVLRSEKLIKLLKIDKERLLKRLLKGDKERAEVIKWFALPLPRSEWLFLPASYGLIIVLILIVRFSPVEMRWIPFIASVLVGYLVMMWLLSAAKKGKIHATGRSIFDILPKETKSK